MRRNHLVEGGKVGQGERTVIFKSSFVKDVCWPRFLFFMALVTLVSGVTKETLSLKER